MRKRGADDDFKAFGLRTGQTEDQFTEMGKTMGVHNYRRAGGRSGVQLYTLALGYLLSIQVNLSMKQLARPLGVQ